MAVRHGYGKIAGADALVFAYDAGDTRNSFKGKPATNHLTRITQQYTPVVEDHFILANDSHVVNVPQMGRRTVQYVDVWNDYNNGSGRCCLSLFTYGTGIDTITGNTTYAYQIVYKTDTGYTNANYMYRYEYGPAGYIREGGLHSTGRRTHLGDGWYHAWGTVTLHPDTTYINAYLFHYEYATQNRVQVAGVMLTEGTEIIPPSQFLEVEQTRSATEGLIDLTGNTSIDISTASFDSNAHMVFDGSDDYLNLGNSSAWDIGGNGTLEMVLRPTNSTGNDRLWCVFNNSSNLDAYLNGTSYNVFMHGGVVGTTTPLIPNQYNHLSVTYNNGTIQIYVNGQPGTMTGTTTGYNITNPGGSGNTNLYLGRFINGTYNLYGDINVFKVYNKGLTAAEVQANFNNYKTRFNIA